MVPDNQLLVETDAPFLTPHPYRGQPNRSYCLPYTARDIARTRGVGEDELAAILGPMPAGFTAYLCARQLCSLSYRNQEVQPTFPGFPAQLPL